MTKSISTNAIGLAIFAVFTAGLISITQVVTKERILENEKLYKSRLLFEILPDADPVLVDNPISLTSARFTGLDLLSLSNPGEYYRDPKTLDMILPVVAPNGYTEAIKLLVGIDKKGSIIDVRIISHRETPGLGDKIEIKKSNWIVQFQGKSLSIPSIEHWKVKKDDGYFDQLTGATVTPRAVVGAIANLLKFYQLNRELLIEVELD